MNCKYCPSDNIETVEMDSGPHFAKQVCGACGRHQCWVKSPENKDKRSTAGHKALLNKFSRGYCECCLRRTGDLPGTQVLEVHHVIEVQNGGTDHRSNIWIVCTKCHKHIHHERTYLGHYHKEQHVSNVLSDVISLHGLDQEGNS